ncbi:hypothetical protein ACHAWF_014273 [Thalassiosira exigua]
MPNWFGRKKEASAPSAASATSNGRRGGGGGGGGASAAQQASTANTVVNLRENVKNQEKREQHLDKKIEQLTAEAKAKMAKGDKKGEFLEKMVVLEGGPEEEGVPRPLCGSSFFGRRKKPCGKNEGGEQPSVGREEASPHWQGVVRVCAKTSMPPSFLARDGSEGGSSSVALGRRGGERFERLSLGRRGSSRAVHPRRAALRRDALFLARGARIQDLKARVEFWAGFERTGSRRGGGVRMRFLELSRIPGTWFRTGMLRRACIAS